MLGQIKRSRFRKINLVHSINFGLYRIRKIDLELSHRKLQKGQRGEVDFRNVKSFLFK